MNQPSAHPLQSDSCVNDSYEPVIFSESTYSLTSVVWFMNKYF